MKKIIAVSCALLCIGICFASCSKDDGEVTEANETEIAQEYTDVEDVNGSVETTVNEKGETVTVTRKTDITKKNESTAQASVKTSAANAKSTKQSTTKTTTKTTTSAAAKTTVYDGVYETPEIPIDDIV